MTANTLAPARSPLAETARALAAAPDEWIRRVRLSIDGRWYERLHQDEDVEIWLLSWMPGQTTGFHDHGGSRGAFAVALGTLREDDLLRERDLAPGDVRAFGPDHIHDVRNVSNAPAVSVHVYSPPLSLMHRYDRTESGLIMVAEERAEQW
ncbi:cysteine dioxygenase family protein [Thermopolyspora sp. NPDC052614]|uniref:cysteine dioxygenase n=1 Tax=Thermopolyspora sp. NPDC052614 TaxID=3155682 RepID=UPI0034470759